MPEGDSPTEKIGGGGAVGFRPPAKEILDAVLPNIEVKGVIGQGGMGAVYRGVQKRLDRGVAVKIMPVDLCVEHQFADRFEREAKAMARLSHQGIVPVYDFGDAKLPDGQKILYLVMELVDGVDLHDLIREGTLDIGRSLNIVSQVCDALAYAHSQGVIHRDIKPANILVDVNKGDSVKVADFGLAKVRGWAQPSLITRADVTMGSPDYVAPESLEIGVKVDFRADIYSLGVVIYQLLTGKVPRGGYVSPSKVGRHLDRRFDRLVDRALARNREKRFQTAGELSAAIEKVRGSSQGSETTSNKKLLPWIVGALVGIAALIWLLILVFAD